MNELIKIKNDYGMQTVKARDLHDFLEIKTDFNNWIKNYIKDFGFDDKKDFVIIYEKSGGRPLKEYYLSIDMAKELSMLSRSEKGKQARLYFIECENKLKDKKEIALTDDQIILQALQIQQNKIKLLEIENTEMKPKADVYDKFMSVNNLHSMNEVGKVLEYGRNKLFELLRSNNILRNNNEPYQQYINAGYFFVKEKEIPNGKFVPVTCVTSKGMIFIKKIIDRNKNKVDYSVKLNKVLPLDIY